MKQHLPLRPHLAHLKHEAKALLRDVRSGQEQAIARCREQYARLPQPAEISLSDAQLVIAREYGFRSWPKLKQYVEGLEAVEQHVSEIRDAFARGDSDAGRRLLNAAHARDRFENYDPDAASLWEDSPNRSGFCGWRGDPAGTAARIAEGPSQ
jgi:hypothetical protein